MVFEKLLSKGHIGRVRLQNRVVMPAMCSGFADFNGEASERLIRYYEERAMGGVGLIITEIFCINEEHGVGVARQMHATNGNCIAGLTRLSDSVHKHGTKIFGQIVHGGNQTDPSFNGGKLYSSSDVPSISGIIPTPLSIEQIEGLVQDYIGAAKLLQLSGFDGVEVHGAHGYLITQFFSRYYNKRTDKYGGSFENRMRFCEEIIRGIRAVCGKDFPISLRMNGDDFLEGVQENNITLPEAVEIAKYFENVGVDALNISCSTYFTGFTAMEPYSYPVGWRKHLAQTIKAAVSVPVIATNTIKAPEDAERLLQEGVSDFVAIGRAHICDPEWTKKAYENRTADIRKCLGCCFCFESVLNIGSIRCAVNPRVGCERTFMDMKLDGGGVPVAVIGGGPSGMQAASLLAKRGFDVTLYEKGATLGGTLLLAEKPAFKDKITRLKETLIGEVEQAGVKVVLNTLATPELVAQKNPAAVFIAAGARSIRPNISGIDGPNVCFAEDVIGGKVQLSGSVAVIGSGLTGLEAAEMLGDAGCAVSIVEMRPQIGPDIYPIILMDIMKRIDARNPQLLPGHKLLSINDSGVELQVVETGEKVSVAVDNVVLSLGVAPHPAILDAFDAKFDKVIAIGDADHAGRIFEALKTAYSFAYNFQP